LKLSVVIVSYNTKFYLEQCLLSLEKALQGIEAETLVVDNHSKDGTVDYITARFPNVKVIASDHNNGFAKANNIALRQASGQYVLLLNPDTVLGEQTIQNVLQFMDSQTNVGALGVRMLKTDGTNANESRRGVPTLMTAFYKLSGLCAMFPKSKRFGRYYMGWLSWDAPAKIEIVSGACCFIHREALNRVGLLDEDFFMYGEDIDLSYRLLKAGFDNWYFPEKILHYKGQSTQKTSFRYVHVFYKAMLIFFEKHYSGLSFLVGLPIRLAIYMHAFGALCKMGVANVRKNLGFPLQKRHAEPRYCFIGSPEMLTDCRAIADRNGWNATYVEGNRETLSQGHLLQPQPDTETVYVYDTASYSYVEILQLFASKSQSKALMGFYHPQTKTVVTPWEACQ